MPARLLIQTGWRLDQLTMADLEAFAAGVPPTASNAPARATLNSPRVSNAQRVLFHLGIVTEPPRSGGPVPFRNGSPRSHRRSAPR